MNTTPSFSRCDYMWRVLPKFWPLWLAPLFVPDWSGMIVSPAFNCSGEKWRTCFSTSFGPIDGLPYLDAYSNQILILIQLIQIKKWVSRQVLFTLRPSAWRQTTTAFRFCFSHRSMVWKSSSAGTPKVLAATKKELMFSIHLKANLLSRTRLIMPGWITLASLCVKYHRVNKNQLLFHRYSFYLLAKEGAIGQLREQIIRISGCVVRLAGQFMDPFQNLLSMFFAVFIHNLQEWKWLAWNFSLPDTYLLFYLYFRLGFGRNSRFGSTVLRHDG